MVETELKENIIAYSKLTTKFHRHLCHLFTYLITFVIAGKVSFLVETELEKYDCIN